MIQSPGMWENWVYITAYTYESLCLINKKMREQLGHTNTAVFVHVTPCVLGGISSLLVCKRLSVILHQLATSEWYRLKGVGTGLSNITR